MKHIDMKIEKKSMSEVITLLNQTDSKDIIFWVGAGIDHDAPTCLPLGDGLRKGVLSKIFSPSEVAALDNSWKSIVECVNKETGKTLLRDVPRLESVIECIQMFEGKIKESKYSVLDGFRCFEQAPPNNNHFVLADFLQHGASIVTTNYDMCIPTAFGSITGKELLLDKSLSVPQSSFYVYGSSDHISGKLYYIHGIAKEPRNIGTSLSKIKNGLCPEFSVLLDNWISGADGKCFVFLGYSGLDSLDVNIYFKAKNNCNSSTGIYIRHDPFEDVSVEITDNQRVLLSAMRERFLCACDTTKLLKSFGSYHRKYSKFEWDCCFRDFMRPYPDRLKSSLVLGLLHALNINPSYLNRFSWHRDAANYSTVDRWYIDYYSFCMAKKMGQFPLILWYGARLHRNQFNPSEVHNRRKKIDIEAKAEFLWGIGLRLLACTAYKMPSENHESLNALMQDHNCILIWPCSSLYNRFATRIMIEVCQHPCSALRIVKKYEEEARFLMKDLAAIINAGYKNVQEVTQIISGCRTIGFFEIVYGDIYNGQQHLLQALEDYSDISSIRGVLGTHVYSALGFGLRYQLTKEKKYLEYARHDFYIATQLQRTIKDKSNAFEFACLKHYFRIIAVF